MISIHVPDFGFEQDTAKVRQATAGLGVRDPNLQDNDYAVWQACGNQGWPGFYFIDAKEKVRGYRVGQGNYAQSEQLNCSLSAEASHAPSAIPLTRLPAAGSTGGG